MKRILKALGLFWRYCVISGAFYPTVPVRVLWRFAWRMAEWKELEKKRIQRRRRG